MDELKDKIAIITGAASGIGRAAARLFASEGAVVVAADLNDAEGHALADEIGALGHTCAFVHTDISNSEQVQAMVHFALSNYGRLDVLFNNAGTEGRSAITHEIALEDWERTIGINLKGVFLGLKYGAEAMLRTGGGSIVNNASAAGLVGFAGSAAYCASKGGVVQLTRAAALDYAQQGVRVNCLCPGIIDTPMIDRAVAGNAELAAALANMEPVGRMGQPEEVAQLALFLASDRASFITGAIVPVDGGLVAR